MLSFSYKINWKQHHEWPRCCWEENICARGAPTFWKHIEHITASPRNYTWHPPLTAILKSITAQLGSGRHELCWLILSLAATVGLLISCHDVLWIMGELNEPCVKRRRQSRGFMYCFIVLLSLGPKGFLVVCSYYRDSRDQQSRSNYTQK